jgi:replication-associated recombination protein RarA
VTTSDSSGSEERHSLEPIGADPWAGVQSPHGFAADELISSLQKYLRRGKLEQALAVAYEMSITSPALEEYLWLRLQVISCEDVGSGTYLEPVVVSSLYEIASGMLYGQGDRWLVCVHAIRYLASRTKDRTSDELANLIKLGSASGELRPEIPDYALDMHTSRGRQMGRGVRHFLEEASKLDNELPGLDKSYRQRLLDSTS